MALCTIETFHRKVRLGVGRYLAVCTAGAILSLISRPSALAAGPQTFSIKVITSLDDQFWTNSVIIEGTHEVMLVDAQLTKTNAERVLQEITKTHKPRTPITFSVWKSLKRRIPK